MPVATRPPPGFSSTESSLNPPSTSPYSVRRAKTKKGRRILEARLPKAHEDTKNSLLFKGSKANTHAQNLLRDLHTLRNPYSIIFSAKNQKNIQPFEDSSEVEHLCKKRDCAFFVMASSSKKKPFRIILGRIFNEQILDMFAFNIQNYLPLSSFYTHKEKEEEGITECNGKKEKEKEHNDTAVPVDSKPLVICQGGVFESNDTLKSAKNLLCEFFSLYNTNAICLNGISHVVVLTAVERNSSSNNSYVNNNNNSEDHDEAYKAFSSFLNNNNNEKNSTNDKASNSGCMPPSTSSFPPPSSTSSSSSSFSNISILFRHYKIAFKNSGSKIPRVELTEVGPSFDMTIDNFKTAPADIWKAATKTPKEVQPKKQKNVKTNLFGEKRGKVHIEKQNFASLHTPHFHKYGKLKRTHQINEQNNQEEHANKKKKIATH